MHESALGELYRNILGIDGTAGDAQDVAHPFIETPDSETCCLVCGLAETYRRHREPGIPAADEVKRLADERMNRVDALRGTLEATLRG